jgi:hypothetical protein
MHDPGKDTAQDNRREGRLPMAEQVTVTLEPQNIVGPGLNISAQGLYFTTTGVVRVRVRIAGSDRTVAGELVRIESMGNGQVGVAIRFAEPLAPFAPL